MKLQKKLIIKFFFVIFIFTTSGYSENNSVSSFSEIDKIVKIDEYSEIIINKPLILNDNKKYNENVTFNFIDNGMIIIPNEKKLLILGNIKSKKKTFHFDNKENYKNLFLKNETFDVRWFDDLYLSQKYSSYHNKKMYFDNYTIEGSIGFNFSNIKPAIAVRTPGAKTPKVAPVNAPANLLPNESLIAFANSAPAKPPAIPNTAFPNLPLESATVLIIVVRDCASANGLLCKLSKLRITPLVA